MSDTRRDSDPGIDPAAAVDPPSPDAPGGAIPPVDPPSGGDAGAGDTSGTPSPAPRQTRAAPPAKPLWQDQRIAQLTADKHKLQQELAVAKGAAPPAAPPAPAASQLSEEEINRRADERAAQRDFNRRCEETDRIGRTAFEDFPAAVTNLNKVFDRNNIAEVQQFNLLLDAAIETGQGAALIHSLGSNLDEAQRLLAMTPIRRAIELTKMAERIVVPSGGEADPPATPSEAPRPPSVTVTGARGGSRERIEPDDATPSANGSSRGDGLDIGTWMARRNEQVKARGLR